MYRCIILDVDGTMLDTLDAELLCLQKVLNKRGIDVKQSDLEFAFGVPTEKVFEKYGIKDIERISTEWNNCMARSISDSHIYDGILDVLERLKDSSIVTGVVTSRTEEELERDFRPLDFFKYFRHIICAEDTKKHKPHPDPLLKFLEISGQKRGDCVYIGDTIHDMQSANAANIDFALAKWGAESPESINTSIILESPKEIFKLAKL